jgi:hypothetical protein
VTFFAPLRVDLLGSFLLSYSCTDIPIFCLVAVTSSSFAIAIFGSVADTSSGLVFAVYSSLLIADF